MSRSRVKRGLAWTTTATPPMTTKSTPACTSAPIRAVGRKAGQLATVHFAGACEPTRLLVHRFKAVHSLRGLEFELLADQAFVHCRSPRACPNNQLDSRRSQGAIQCG